MSTDTTGVRVHGRSRPARLPAGELLTTLGRLLRDGGAAPLADPDVSAVGIEYGTVEGGSVRIRRPGC
ncbi:hypothetical protein SAMN05660657_03572 [Geodermatophilus amargosae]|uniref:Uncharacterized protein n=1 Tax=Geodermatophilus amargosae TaxID=1296565 RepID=A0A1I7BHC3_9ACTN|nr:hypothetical protein [Geodermatophilus amargosae]SFT86575.1 hypothetical protein SAMN05660657_03572 [Geodermatophilus amargosae]